MIETSRRCINKEWLMYVIWFIPFVKFEANNLKKIKVFNFFEFWRMKEWSKRAVPILMFSFSSGGLEAKTSNKLKRIGLAQCLLRRLSAQEEISWILRCCIIFATYNQQMHYIFNN
jgi:hypothetical protein